MNESNQVTQLPLNISEEHILVLSWNIATKPELYRELALNPYSPAALQIIFEKFTLFKTNDIIRAVILAEPESSYDRFFRQLTEEQQKTEIFRHNNQTTEIAGRLNAFYNQHKLKFTEFSEDLIYDILFKTAFETNDFREAEQKYSQNQRKSIKLLILSLISESQNLRIRVTQENLQFVAHKSQKTFLRIALVVILLIPFLLLTLFPDKPGLVVNAVLPQKTVRTLPVRLVIPSINVDATVEDVGVTAGGAMDTPTNTVDVGWYQFGISPGEIGSAVISGHLDTNKGEFGVFNNLDKLKPGDKIYVINDQDVTNTFVVRESKTYDPGYADEVFSSNDGGIHLNLVTCDGIWDKNKKGYSKRLVVFADLVRE